MESLWHKFDSLPRLGLGSSLAPSAKSYARPETRDIEMDSTQDDVESSYMETLAAQQAVDEVVENPPLMQEISSSAVESSAEEALVGGLGQTHEKSLEKGSVEDAAMIKEDNTASLDQTVDSVMEEAGVQHEIVMPIVNKDAGVDKFEDVPKVEGMKGHSDFFENSSLAGVARADGTAAAMVDAAVSYESDAEPVQAQELSGVAISRSDSGHAFYNLVTYSSTRVLPVDPDVLKNNRIINGAGTDPVTNAYKILRTQVLQAMNLHNWSTLAITSAGAREGKTLNAINLAISIARDINHTVVLVDANLGGPAVADYFGIEPEFGLYDYLFHDVPLKNILLNPGVNGLVILPGREFVTNSSELLVSPKMISLVDELKARYPRRMVLFDLPPVLEADDVIAFSPYVDAALLVVEEGKTRKKDLQRTVDMLQGINILGSTINKCLV